MKLAKETFGYSDKSPDVWIKDVTNYMVGQDPEMIQYLHWIEERQAQEIHFDDVKGMSIEGGGHVMLDRLDPIAASQKMWAWLNLAVSMSASAKRTFLAVEKLNGAEAWGRPVVPHNSRSLVR